MTDYPQSHNIRSICGTIRLSYHPEWSISLPWAAYRYGTAGLHFATLAEAKRHFNQYVFTE